MAKLTIDQYIKKLKKDLKEVKSGKDVFTAAKTVQQKMSERVFERGLDQNGRQFKYSTKGPIWVSSYVPKSQKGKYASYADFKNKNGGKYFKLRGLLQKDFNENVKKINDFEYVIDLRSDNMDKVKGIEDKHKNAIFTKVSNTERKLFSKILQKETIKRFLK